MLLPLYLQNARGYTAIEAGLLMLPGALIMGFLMPVTGRLFDRFGAKRKYYWAAYYDRYDPRLY
ncbi:MFS transporter [Paenibacillus sp. E222]|nr:MFS transporter [Paenibacillus sp. E222]